MVSTFAKLKLAGALLACTGVGLAVSNHAVAQTSVSQSTYTSTAQKDCHAAKGDSSSRVCPGAADLSVVISEGDLRETVSAGLSAAAAANEPAAKTSFGPFNSTTPTIEWRAAPGKPPYAMIQRWYIADINDEDKTGRPRTKALLVVTRLPPDAVCHVAYIDAAANPDANELARKVADETAASFDCAKDKVKIAGQSGRAVQLALPAR